MKDTPQSCGLPAIEKWRNDYPDDYNEKTYENNLTTKEIFVTYGSKQIVVVYRYCNVSTSFVIEC